MNLPPIDYFDLPDKRRIAFRHSPGTTPTVLFHTGFRSDMESTKAAHLMRWCMERGQACMLFDYTGHGHSSGVFAAGSIGDWLSDAQAVFDRIEDDRKLLVGSSMGGWIALLLALRNPAQVSGILTIACAADFITEILIPNLNQQHRQELKETGLTRLQSDYEEEPYSIGRNLVDAAGAFEILQGPIALECPVELIHGLADEHIPWETSLRVMQRLESSDARLSLIKSGTHRLSEEPDLAAIAEALERLLQHPLSTAR